MEIGRMTNHPKRKSLFLWAGIGLLAMALVACGGGDNETAATEDAAPSDQQELRVRLNSEPRTLDPHRSNLAVEASVNKSLFSGLFTYDEDLNVVANLASEVPTVDNGGISSDGKVYTITLVEDTKWSDGSALTANDFVYSMKRALDPKTASPYASYFFSVVGARDYATALGTAAAPKTPSDTDLAAMREKVGVTAKDARTIVYELSTPNPSFLNQLAIWTSYPVKQDVVEKFGDQWTEAENHVGNGPFVLAEWQHNQKIVLEKNANWHGDNLPVLERIEYSIIADDAAAYASYLAGELDTVVVPASARREITSPASGLSDELRRQPELGTYGFFMNQGQAPFDNLNVRKAFTMAIDRDALVEGVIQGAGRPATSWIPPGMPGFDASSGTNLEFNVTKAKQALSDAGYKDGAGFPEVTLLFAAVDANRVLGQFLQAQLKTNLNIDVKLDFIEGPAYGGRFTTKQYQATVIRWGSDWAYPDNWLPNLFSSSAGNNFTNYANPTFDALMTRAASESDDEERLALYKAGHSLVLGDAVISPLYYRENFVLTKPYVKNLQLTALDGFVGGDYNFAKTYIAAH